MIEPCRIEHLMEIELQPAQQHMREFMTPQFLQQTLSRGCAYTVMGVERPAICFGFYPWGSARGCVWAYFDRDARRQMVSIHRYAERFLTTLTGRIFAMVECRFGAGTRWVQLLGFQRVGNVPEYGLAKRPHDVYLQVRA
jgi:hypothetical protein